MVDRPLRPANDDDAAVRSPRRRVWILTGAGLFVLFLLVALPACVLWIPNQLYPPLTEADLHDVIEMEPPDPAKVQELKDARLKLQNDARTTLLQGLAALLVLVGAGLGAVVTLRQVRISRDQLEDARKRAQDEAEQARDQLGVARKQLEAAERQAREQLALAEQGQVTERFTRAVDQLGSDKMDVRLGGIYALGRIASDSSRDRPAVGEVLVAFVRGHAPWPPSRPGQYVEDALIGDVPALSVRAQDVHAALAVLGTEQFWFVDKPGRLPSVDLRSADLPKIQLRHADLSRAQLRGADLSFADLQWAQLDFAHLQGANLAGAKLQHAKLMWAHLERPDLADRRLAKQLADDVEMARQFGLSAQDVHVAKTELLGAELEGAWLEGTDLRGASLQNVNLRKALLWRADLREADLRQADLQEAKLRGLGRGADLRGANLRGANLRGTDLAKLPHQNLMGAKADATTAWPDDFDMDIVKKAGIIVAS